MRSERGLGEESAGWAKCAGLVYLTFVGSLPILYEDDSFIAVAKPSGALVHASKYAGPERTSLARDLAKQLGRPVFPVHRLDRGTSGVLLFGLSGEAVSSLSPHFRDHRITKEYLAVVRGWAPLSGRVDRALRNDETGEIQDAITEFERLATAEVPLPIDHFPATRVSLVRARPLTGRTHQIRRHLRGLSHPILGDVVHGDGPINRFARGYLGVHRLLLHASRLSFEHPLTHDRVSIESPLPTEFVGVIEKLGWARNGTDFTAKNA